MQFLSMFNLQPVTAIVQRFSPVAENLGISEIACAVRAAGAGIVCRPCWGSGLQARLSWLARLARILATSQSSEDGRLLQISFKLAAHSAG